MKYKQLTFSVAVCLSFARILRRVFWWSVTMVMRYIYDIISSRWSSHFWVKMHVFSTSFNNKSNDSKYLFMCYFTCQAQKLPFFAVLTWFLILGKIQVGDHWWWCHRPPASPPPIKYTSSCWADQTLSTEGKIASKYCYISKPLGRGSINPPPPLYHGGGMNLHVCQRFKSVENKSIGKGLVFFLKKWCPRFHVLEVRSLVTSCQYFAVLNSTCLHHCPCFNPIFASFFDLSSVPCSCFKAVLLVRILLQQDLAISSYLWY